MLLNEGQITANADGYCQFLADEDAKHLRAQIVSSLKSHQVFEVSHRLLLPNNEVKYIEDAVKRGHISGNGYYTNLCQKFFP